MTMTMRMTARSFLSVLLLLTVASVLVKAEDDGVVSCGSAVKLTHVESGSKHYLSSENKNLGSGSGQQIVTWNDNKSSTDGLWWLRGPDGEEDCGVEAIECGATIRLTHLNTRRNLHTHGIPSPLSRQQEISGFGGDGQGDSGDNWMVQCTGKYWRRGQKVRLMNIDTGRFQGGSANVKSTQQNCGQSCPILHHLEAFGRKQKDDYSWIKAEMGVFLSK